MALQVKYIGKPAYIGEFDLEIFPGHLFDITVHPDYGRTCPLSPHIHVRSVKYPRLAIELYDGEYITT